MTGVHNLVQILDKGTGQTIPNKGRLNTQSNFDPILYLQKTVCIYPNTHSIDIDICMCIYMYIYVHTHTYACAYSKHKHYMYKYRCTYIYMYLYLYVYLVYDCDYGERDRERKTTHIFPTCGLQLRLQMNFTMVINPHKYP